jgi:signal transduction histidine kinase
MINTTFQRDNNRAAIHNVANVIHIDLSTTNRVSGDRIDHNKAYLFEADGKETGTTIDIGRKLGTVETGAFFEVGAVVDGAVERHRCYITVSLITDVVDIDPLITGTDKVTVLVFKVHGQRVESYRQLIERAAKIVQNLLTFARHREPKKGYSDVNNIVQSALELRAYELKTSDIEVITNLAPDMPKIMLDFHQIQEVFLNLILNAEQAMTEANSGGKLTIKTEKNKRYIRSTFSDDGPGIPAENLDKIFDPFFTTKGERGGTGLGLSVCHGIITEHGGKIYAKCKPGKGTTFIVELPIIAEE